MFFAAIKGHVSCASDSCFFNGMNRANATTVFFVQDEVGDVSMAVFHGSTAESTAGHVQMGIFGSMIKGLGAGVEKFTSAGALSMNWYGGCSGVTTDCHSWDNTLGAGFFSWDWVSLVHFLQYISIIAELMQKPLPNSLLICWCTGTG